MTDSRGDAATQPLVVIGDVLLDIDVVGTAARLSPEAPVPAPAAPSSPGAAPGAPSPPAAAPGEPSNPVSAPSAPAPTLL